MPLETLQKLARLVRYFILTSSTAAGSGHPTSSLSAVDMMTILMFGGYFKFDIGNPGNPNNDRLIFSKGHASPLFYAMWAIAAQHPLPQSLPLRGGGKGEGEKAMLQPLAPDELLTMRKFGSRLEGHPTPAFPFTEAATGSLGQGLSIGVGMALNAKLDKLDYKTYILLGDSEMAEGSVWEAIQLAAHYKLDNLVGILDVNRLGQRGETMYGHDVAAYEKRVSAFGWETMVIDGHNLEEIRSAFAKATADNVHEPIMIIGRTLKGAGIPYFENKENWHGKPLTAEELKSVLQEFGEVDKEARGGISKPATSPQPSPISERVKGEVTRYKPGDKVATRKAYGNALVNIYPQFPEMVVLDAEVSNSTYSEIFRKIYPERFLEMYIAEQNMVGTALGLSRRGKIPFVSTFAAFFTRAFDQIRMSQYSEANIKFCGSHAGVSIGEDGPSQMGLEDIAMFRTLLGSVVLYPSDAVSTEKLVEEAAKHKGIVYIRTTRKETPIIYQPPLPPPASQATSPPLQAGRCGQGALRAGNPPHQGEGIKKESSSPSHKFKIGGSCVLRSSSKDVATVVAAGITLHEALAAHEELQKSGINIRVIDLYSVKPLDLETLKTAAKETGRIITVEDHFAEGGIGEAVASAFSSFPPQAWGGPPVWTSSRRSRAGIKGEVESRRDRQPLSSSPLARGEGRIISLAVRKMPRSGKPEELLEYEEISSRVIIKTVMKVI